MLEILPNTDWSHELIRPGLNLILRRLDRLFTKISKKSALRVGLNVYSSLSHLNCNVYVCIYIIINKLRKV